MRTALHTTDPTTDGKWQRFVQASADAGIFHHPSWVRLLRDQYDFETVAAYLERDGEIVAGIPLCGLKGMGGRQRWICLPFSDYCGPLARSAEDVAALMDGVRHRFGLGNARLEIRCALDPDCGFAMRKEHLLHVLTIDRQPSELRRAFRANFRNCLRRAQDNGLTTEIRHDVEALDTFYHLHVRTRRRQGVPVQPRRYFQLFHKHIVQQNLGFVTVTRRADRYLSAGVFCGFNNVLIYKYGASDPDYTALLPNYLMLWQTMLHARQHGFAKLDFGKTPCRNHGLRTFKRGWGAEEWDLQYSYSPDIPSGRVMTALNQRLVEPFIKHSPLFVCRMTGELLYKHFGA